MNGSNSNTSGNTVAELAYTPKGASDQVSDSVFQEIVRRLSVTFEGGTNSDISGDATAPADKTLIWWPKDPTTGARVGQPQIFSSTSNSWVALGQSNITLPVVPQTRAGNQGVITQTGAQSVNVTFTPLSDSTTNYALTITPSTYGGAAQSYGAGPSTLTGFGWVITNKANNQFTVLFFAVPAGVQSFDWKLTEILP